MKINVVLQKSVAVLVLAAVILLAACSQPVAQDTPAVDEPSTEVMVIDGETLLEDRCIQCHDLERTTSKNKTLDGWTQTVARMVQKGATLNAEEQAVLIDYLVENYGPATE